MFVMFNRTCFYLGRMARLYMDTRIFVMNLGHIDGPWRGVKIEQGITFGLFGIVITKILMMMLMEMGAWSWRMDNIRWG